MAIQNMPAAEVRIDDGVVGALLAEQHPDLAALPLAFLSEGWDNVMFRLGDGLIVRLPRRQLSVVLVEHEQRWLPELAERLPLPIPAPVRVGVPGSGYPWPWSVVPWIDGVSAADTQAGVAVFAEPSVEARRVGEFLAALHQPAPVGTPENPFRGVPLGGRDESTRERFDQLAGVVDTDALIKVWESGLAAEPWSRSPMWLHGDLHLANIVVNHGRVVSVIDWGDITSGDPATDLACAWMLFGPDDRAVMRVAAGGIDGVDDATWARARAWAVTLGLAYLVHSADNPVMGQVGERVLAAVLDD